VNWYTPGMPNVAFARSDSAHRARAAAVLASPERLAKLSPERQNYVVFASDAMGWWIDDQGKAGEDVDLAGGFRRYEAIILRWLKEADDTPDPVDVWKALQAERRAQVKSERVAAARSAAG